MIENRLELLILEKSAEWERRITLKEISQKTGLAEATLIRLKSKNSKGIRYDVLDKLCTFFNVTPDDILIYIPDGNGQGHDHDHDGDNHGKKGQT